MFSKFQKENLVDWRSLSPSAWIDDGARDLHNALSLAYQLVHRFQKVIATPHVFEGRNFLSPEIIHESVAFLNLELGNGLPLKVLPGAEYYIFRNYQSI